jgi:hypothetical protein
MKVDIDKGESTRRGLCASLSSLELGATLLDINGLLMTFRTSILVSSMGHFMIDGSGVTAAYMKNNPFQRDDASETAVP